MVGCAFNLKTVSGCDSHCGLNSVKVTISGLSPTPNAADGCLKG